VALHALPDRSPIHSAAHVAGHTLPDAEAAGPAVETRAAAWDGCPLPPGWAALVACSGQLEPEPWPWLHGQRRLLCPLSQRAQVTASCTEPCCHMLPLLSAVPGLGSQAQRFPAGRRNRHAAAVLCHASLARRMERDHVQCHYFGTSRPCWHQGVCCTSSLPWLQWRRARCKLVRSN
jgi:hypothetical protein